MPDRTDDHMADKQTGQRLLVLGELPAEETFRLASLSDTMVTPWQIPPLLAETAAPPPSPRRAMESVTEFVVAWQLNPAGSSAGQHQDPVIPVDAEHRRSHWP